MPKTTHNYTKFRPDEDWWDERRRLAADLVWADEENDEAIARRLGVCRRTLGYWKAHPLFAAEIQRRAEEWSARLRRETLARFGLSR